MEVEESWRVYQEPEETVDDSDKSFATLLNTERQILWIWVELTTTATVGNRQLVVQVLDAAGDLIATLARAGATQAASLTRYYLFAPGVADMLAFRDTDYLTTPIPVTSFLDGGQVLRVYDKAAIAPAADDMIVQFSYAARSVVQ